MGESVVVCRPISGLSFKSMAIGVKKMEKNHILSFLIFGLEDIAMKDEDIAI